MMIARAMVAPDESVIERCDFWRRSPASVGGAAGHKEWSYFCVLGQDLQLVVVFSITDHANAAVGDRGRIEEPRVTLLAHATDTAWFGSAEPCDPAALTMQAGRIAARFGSHALNFAQGVYTIDGSVGSPPARVSLTLRPSARPALTRSIPLGSGPPMQWFVVPRLEASGNVDVNGRIHQLHACPAYHDHNWGRFHWGGNFAWEWGIALSPSAPECSLVYYRITDRARHVVVSQGLLLWVGGRHSRTLRDADLRVRSQGTLRTAGCLRVPRGMHLAVEGSAADLPTRLEISGSAGRDTLDVVFDLTTCAQICIPNDGPDDDGTTGIWECPGAVVVTGHIGGRSVNFSGRALVEFNRGAA